MYIIIKFSDGLIRNFPERQKYLQYYIHVKTDLSFNFMEFGLTYSVKYKYFSINKK